MPPDEHSASLAARLRPGNAITRGSASTRWQLFWLAAITSLAAFLRLWQAGESLWIDELHTSWVVSGLWRDVLPRAAMGNQSPLYFWGMWLLVQVAGQSEWTLRLPSLVAGIALPAAVWLLVGRSFRAVQENRDGPEGPPYVALAAALLVAIDPVCIFYAQEARPYSWVMLLAVMELVLLKRLIEQPTLGRRMALLANSLVLFHLHYTSAIFLAGIVAMLPMLVRLAGSAYRTKSLIIDLLVAAALAAGGVIQMADIFKRRTNWEAFVHQPSWQELFTKVPFALWVLVGGIVVGLAFFVPRVLPRNALTRGSASAAPAKTSPAILWYLALLGSILIPLTLSWSITALDAARIYHIRYLVALVPLSAAAVCLATAWIPWRDVQLFVVMALAGWHLYDGRMLYQFVRDGRFLAARTEDWRAAVADLNQRLKREPSAKLVLDAGLIESRRSLASDETKEYEQFALQGVYRIEADGQAFLGTPPSRINDLNDVARLWRSFHSGRSPATVLVIVRGSYEGAVERYSNFVAIWQSLLDTDPRPTFVFRTRRSFGYVHIFQIDVTYEPNPDALIKWRSRNRSRN